MKMKVREEILFQGVESGSESESEVDIYIYMSYRTSDSHIKIERREITHHILSASDHTPLPLSSLSKANDTDG